MDYKYSVGIEPVEYLNKPRHLATNVEDLMIGVYWLSAIALVVLLCFAAGYFVTYGLATTTIRLLWTSAILLSAILFFFYRIQTNKTAR